MYFIRRILFGLTFLFLISYLLISYASALVSINPFYSQLDCSASTYSIDV